MLCMTVYNYLKYNNTDLDESPAWETQTAVGTKPTLAWSNWQVSTLQVSTLTKGTTKEITIFIKNLSSSDGIQIGQGDCSSNRIKIGQGNCSSDRIQIGQGDCSSHRIQIGQGDCSSDRIQKGHGDCSSDKIQMGQGDCSSDRIQIGQGDQI